MVGSSKVILAGTVPQVVEDCKWYKSWKNNLFIQTRTIYTINKEKRDVAQCLMIFSPKWRTKSALGDREVSLKWSWKKELRIKPKFKVTYVMVPFAMLQGSCQLSSTATPRKVEIVKEQQ